MNGHSGPSNVGDSQAPYTNGPPANGGLHVDGYPQQSSYQLHNEAILQHLYHAGFQTGNYADTLLHVLGNVYRLHAIILSRSPFLAHLMSTSPQMGGQRTIVVHLEREPEVTHDGFAIAIGYLYSAESLKMLRPENARAVLAAACLLGGMEDLCGCAYTMCRDTISVENISEWLEFVESIPSPSDGASTPIEAHQLQLPRTAVFGPYAQRLKHDVFDFLVVRLPAMFIPKSPTDGTQADNSPGDAARDTLLQIYAQVPFDLFKAAVESPSFAIGSEQARFKFAKDAIELRKRGIARGQGAEETVVLAFGGNNMGDSPVHVTRKLRKRPLWKINS